MISALDITFGDLGVTNQKLVRTSGGRWRCSLWARLPVDGGKDARVWVVESGWKLSPTAAMTEAAEKLLLEQKEVSHAS